MNFSQNAPLPLPPVAFTLLGMLAALSQVAPAAPGDLDLSFGGTGKVVVGTGNAWSVAVQKDGKVVLAGTSLVRLNVTGSLDSSFGGSGIVATQVSSSSDQGNSVAVQKDAKIVTVGFSGEHFAVERFLTTGNPDSTFGSGGRVITNVGSLDHAHSVVVQTDGKIVVAGYATIQNPIKQPPYQINAFALVRYNPNGSLDKTFGGTGKVTTGADSYGAKGRSVALQADGKVLVVGLAGQNEDATALVRYNTDGNLDVGFGDNGIVTESSMVGKGVAAQSDGKIVVVGTSGGYSNSKVALRRYNADGTRDNTLGGSGAVTTNISIGTDDGHAVAVQSDGKIVVGGHTVVPPLSPANQAFFVTRYNSDGSLDTTFHSTGTTITDFGINNDAGWAIALQTDGRIVAAGYSDNGMAAVRYQGDAPLPFAMWKLQHLGQANPPDLEDPDGDGMSTLAEYGLASLPEIPTHAPTVTLFDDPKAGRRLRMLVQRDPTHNDVTVEVQVAGDVAGPWTTVATSALGAPFTGPGYTAGDGVTPGVKTVDVRDTVNVADAGRRFMRVRVRH